MPFRSWCSWRHCFVGNWYVFAVISFYLDRPALVACIKSNCVIARAALRDGANGNDAPCIPSEQSRMFVLLVPDGESRFDRGSRPRVAGRPGLGVSDSYV